MTIIPLEYVLPKEVYRNLKLKQRHKIYQPSDLSAIDKLVEQHQLKAFIKYLFLFADQGKFREQGFDFDPLYVRDQAKKGLFGFAYVVYSHSIRPHRLIQEGTTEQRIEWAHDAIDRGMVVRVSKKEAAFITRPIIHGLVTDHSLPTVPIPLDQIQFSITNLVESAGKSMLIKIFASSAAEIPTIIINEHFVPPHFVYTLPDCFGRFSPALMPELYSVKLPRPRPILTPDPLHAIKLGLQQTPRLGLIAPHGVGKHTILVREFPELRICSFNDYFKYLTGCYSALVFCSEARLPYTMFQDFFEWLYGVAIGKPTQSVFTKAIRKNPKTLNEWFADEVRDCDIFLANSGAEIPSFAFFRVVAPASDYFNHRSSHKDPQLALYSKTLNGFHGTRLQPGIELPQIYLPRLFRLLKENLPEVRLDE